MARLFSELNARGDVDRFTLKAKEKELKFDGTIKNRSDNKLFIELYGKVKRWCEEDLFDITFQINRMSYQLQHLALSNIQKHELFDILIHNWEYYVKVPGTCISKRSAHPSLNEEQAKAVETIVNGDYYPLPYLLYGPPGTGKTKTLVAAIEQIVKKTWDKNILVCAQSNAACDEIAERLSPILSPKEMIRLYSLSRGDNIKQSLKDYSNLFDGEIKFPPLSDLYKYRVVICTLATAGCITRANCDPDHFQYVIIDECASAHETITLVPIAGLCTSLRKVHANIVLAGDPKQLDAVTKSVWAIKLKFGKSFFEQLIELPRYEIISGEDSVYVTQLVKNYRSHKAILHIPNQLFYQGVLEAKTSPNIADLNISLPKLRPDFPVLFKSIQGNWKRPESETRFVQFSFFFL